MSQTPPDIHHFADLSARKRQALRLEPDAATRAAMAQALGIVGIRKLRFDGALMPLGRRDWALEGDLGATVVQECVVTLDPVATRIDEPVRRVYQAEFTPPEGTEVEMPEDDSVELLPARLDLNAVLIEAIALALPPYPRAPEAETGEAVFTEPGKAPLRDADLNPFAGLAKLRDMLPDASDGPDPDKD